MRLRGDNFCEVQVRGGEVGATVVHIVKCQRFVFTALGSVAQYVCQCVIRTYCEIYINSSAVLIS